MNEVIELMATVSGRIIVPPGETAHILVVAMPEPAYLRGQLALYESFGFHGLPSPPAISKGRRRPRRSRCPEAAVSTGHEPTRPVGRALPMTDRSAHSRQNARDLLSLEE
jgi:hypothetical protein